MGEVIHVLNIMKCMDSDIMCIMLYGTPHVDDGNCVDLIYFDYKKAFDKVAHHRLLCKLKSLGLSSNVICWIEGFLSNRRQRVVINGTKSEWSNVTSGVPQGSVLGPILFLVFVADITEVVESDMILFADDTKLYRKIESEEDSHILQRDIDNLYLWSKDWLMEFNKDKCKTIHYGHMAIIAYATILMKLFSIAQ